MACDLILASVRASSTRFAISSPKESMLSHSIFYVTKRHATNNHK